MRKITMNKQNYRPKEAAAYLGIGLSTFWLFAKQKRIKTTKLSERVTVIRLEELERFIAEAEGGAA